MDYLVLRADGQVEEMVIGDKDNAYECIAEVFKTVESYGNFFEASGIKTFSAADVSIAVNSDDATDNVREFASSLKGYGYQLIAHWHENGRALHQDGVYQENLFLAGKGRNGIYGPVVLGAQQHQFDKDPVEVSASKAIIVAEMIVNAKGLPVDLMFKI